MSDVERMAEFERTGRVSVMPGKGSIKGECFTPDCTNGAKWIATTEAPHADVPQERYRCARCCELVNLATPTRDADVFPGLPGWDEWKAEVTKILALPLKELETASAPMRDLIYTVTGEDLERIANAFRNGNPETMRLDFRRSGVVVKFDGGMWSHVLGSASPRE